MRTKNKFLKILLLIEDIIFMYVALFSALALRYGDLSFLPGPQTRVFLFHFSIIHIFWLVFLFALDFYEVPPLKKIYDFLRNLMIFIFLAGGFGVIYFYLKPQAVITPKTILVLDVLIFSLFLFVWRYLFNKILRTKNFKERVIVVGADRGLKDFLLSCIKRSDYEIIAFFDVGQNIGRLKEIVNENKVKSIIFALDIYRNKELSEQIFSNLPLELDFISFNSFYETITRKISLNTIDELWFLENISQTKRRIYELAKRSFDVFFSFLGLIITGIIFPFVALAIKLDSQGSIFYIQKRIGKNGKKFNFYKFRSMKETVSQYKDTWREKDPNQITKVGRILRKTHIDEFPQFWSILKGNLSFVGPRPEWERLAEVFEKNIPFYHQRYLIRPGFTGWAQLHYPPSTSVEQAKEKFQYDLYYIKNRSFFFDLAILFKTIQLVFR